MKRWQASNTNVTKMSLGCENEVKVPKLINIHTDAMTEVALRKNSQNSTLRIWVQLFSILFEFPFVSTDCDFGTQSWLFFKLQKTLYYTFYSTGI